MDIVTITTDAKNAIAALLNKSILVEYDMILGYPRIIDHITNFERIKDKQLINDIDQLGRASLQHFSKTDNLISRFGSKTAWQIPILPRLVEALDILEKQLEKENLARDIYRDAKKVVMNNRTTIRGREFFGRTFRVKSGIDEDVITADEIIYTLDHLIMDEERHARIVKDSIATLNMLMKK